MVQQSPNLIRFLAILNSNGLLLPGRSGGKIVVSDQQSTTQQLVKQHCIELGIEEQLRAFHDCDGYGVTKLVDGLLNEVEANNLVNQVQALQPISLLILDLEESNPNGSNILKLVKEAYYSKNKEL